MPLHAAINVLIVPPINLLLLAILGLLITRWRRVAGSRVTIVGIVGLLIFALPLIPDTLRSLLEILPETPAFAPVPMAIVILSGDTHNLDGTGRKLSVGSLTLERLQTGAALYRATHLPVLVTGGKMNESSPSLAKLMTDSLAADFDVPIRWHEDRSRTTWENAEYSAAILKAAGIDSVFLVTHAWHMRRALIAFNHFGIIVKPEPVAPDLRPRFLSVDLVPSAKAWLNSYYVMHEWIGCAWYILLAHW